MTSLVKSERDLAGLASALSSEARKSGGLAISRLNHVITDSRTFLNGRVSTYEGSQTNLNLEDIGKKIYTSSAIDDFDPSDFSKAAIARDLQQFSFNFDWKGNPLPKGEEMLFEAVPEGIGHYDRELLEFSKSHPGIRVSRVLRVDQKIVANSEGGIAIQSIPYFTLSYVGGMLPLPLSRNLGAVCTTKDDIAGLSRLITYLPDPTPDGRIRNSRTFTEAFSNLHSISPLRFENLEKAGIPLSSLYDVVMLTGVPIHEIFGHQFEEPIRRLEFGESGTFKAGQKISNAQLTLKDDPFQKLEGYRLMGHTVFDAYGRKRAPTTHISEGKIQGFLGGEYSDAMKMGSFFNSDTATSVGCSFQFTDGFFPQPRMSCTVLSGESQAIDLEGKILLIPHEGHTNTSDKTYMVKAFEAYIVRGGIPLRIIPVQVTGGINQALENMTLLPNTTYQTGMCGKPEPIYFPRSIGLANAPVSEVAKNQLWKNQQLYPLPLTPHQIEVYSARK